MIDPTNLNSAAQPSNALHPGRFTLRELFILTALVCIAGALYSWAGIEPGFAGPLFFIAAFATVIFVVHMLTRWSLLGVFVAIAALTVLGALLLPPTHHGPGHGRRGQCSNHLKQIGLALQNYHDEYGSFPPAHIADSKGNPIHSWRVLILPFIEQKPLYDRYSFNEPWDGPNNRKLHNEIMRVYCCPSCPEDQPKTDTSYVAVMGPNTMWPGAKATNFSDLTDGTSNTIMVVEIYNSGIHWMEPRDLHMAQMPLAVNPQQGQGISSTHPNVALAVFADGHTAALSSTIPPDILRLLLTIADGEPIGEY